MDRTVIDALNWRYAVKQFDADATIEPEKVGMLIESARLSPSAAGLQPYRLVVVETREMREQLAPHSMMNAEKIKSASSLLVLAIYSQLSAETFQTHLNNMAAHGLIPALSEDEAAERYKRFMTRMPQENDFRQWAHKQAYLALGTLLCAAAMLGIDACPMEGFDAKEYDTMLGLSALGLTSSVILAVGKRSPQDPGQHKTKYRRASSVFVLKK